MNQNKIHPMLINVEKLVYLQTREIKELQYTLTKEIKRNIIIFHH